MRLVAPELLWSEATSVLHEAAWRGRLEPHEAGEALRLVFAAPIATRRPRELRTRAWAIAHGLGWARTYEAEYCALAELLGCELVTSDRRDGIGHLPGDRPVAAEQLLRRSR